MDSINFVDISAEMLILVAEACVWDVQGLVALSSACMTLKQLIRDHPRIWRLLFRNYFAIDPETMTLVRMSTTGSFPI